MKIYLIITFFFFMTISYGQNINKNWEQDLNKVLQEFKECDGTAISGINPCYQFIGQTLQTVYQNNDFYSTKLGRYMMVSEIADFLNTSDQWKLIGLGYEQKALNEAQDHANSGKAVVAVYLDEDRAGHLSVILPGKLYYSGTWKFNVPNSTSFFMLNPEASYINKGLSYAFIRSQVTNVKIYAR